MRKDSLEFITKTITATAARYGYTIHIMPDYEIGLICIFVGDSIIEHVSIQKVWIDHDRNGSWDALYLAVRSAMKRYSFQVEREIAKELKK